jgi:hypothetical protein
MNPVLSQLERELSSALHSLDSTQTQLLIADDDPSRRSIHQIVQHLLLAYASTAASFESRLAKGTPTRARPTTRHRAVQFVVITLGLMPGRHQAPPEVTPADPASPLSGDELTHAVSQALANLDLIFNHAEQSFGPTPCLTHFTLGPLSAPQWRRFHLSHGRHHIRQILSIRRARGI